MRTKTQVSNVGGGGGWPSSAQIRYPNQVLNSDSDYVKIEFYEYRPPFSSQGFERGGISAYNRSVGDGIGIGQKKGGTLYLYMPQDVSVQYGAQWDDMNISNIARGALGSAGKAFDSKPAEALGEFFNTVGDSIKNATSKGTIVAKALSEALRATNFGNVSVNDIYAGITGQILNPNTEVLYKGPKMRGFSLEFKMVPEDNTEAKAIKDIITSFKYATLPTFGNVGTDSVASFVKVPAIVDVTFMTGNSPNPNVTQFKPCAITDLDISYTPDGAWSTYTDGSPVATTLKVTLQELKMLYADEIKDGY